MIVVKTKDELITAIESGKPILELILSHCMLLVSLQKKTFLCTIKLTHYQVLNAYNPHA